jgi:hypothetical protein
MKPLRAAVALVAVLSVKMIVENLYFHAVVKYATQVRGSLAGLIFDKSLRLASGSGHAPLSASDKKDGNTAGKALGAGGVLNLMQSDTSILESTALQIHTIWDGPLQVRRLTYKPKLFLSESFKNQHVSQFFCDSMITILCRLQSIPPFYSNTWVVLSFGALRYSS